MSDIGFQLGTEEAFQQLASSAREEGEAFETAEGTYVKWAPGGGVELWVQLDRGGDLLGLNPHFSGSSLMRVGLTERITRSEDRPLDGAFYAWANPAGDDAESGDYPFVFDVPDYHLNSAISLPCLADVQLSAFAHGLHSYENDEAYDRAHSKGIKFAPESFIPSGTFTLEGSDIDPPLAHAVFTGHVLESSIIANPATDNEFIWAKVCTLGGEIDVVADPVLLNGPIVKDGIVSGSFWLSGRIARSSLTKR